MVNGKNNREREKKLSYPAWKNNSVEFNELFRPQGSGGDSDPTQNMHSLIFAFSGAP